MGHLKLHNYQHRAIDFWLNNPRTYLAIDMGLGKTAIVLHSLVKLDKPALVIAPLSACYTTWPDEIEKWNIPLSHTILHGRDRDYNFTLNRDIYITNYESLPWLYEKLYQRAKRKKKFPFEVAIIDEGSKLKSHKTKRFDYMKALRQVFPKYRVILSGTPAPNSLLDLWSQYYFLCDGKVLEKQYYAFKRKHFLVNEYNPFEFTIKKGSEEKIYKEILPYTFRLDAKDYLDLPEIVYNYIPLKLTPKLVKMYVTYRKEFILTVNEIDHVAISKASLSNKLRQFLSGFNYYTTDETEASGNRKIFATDIHKLKLTALKQLVEDINQPVLCAIQYKHELKMIKKVYPKAPVIAGGTKPTDVTKYIRQWNRKELPLLLCHPASLSHGVNLQSGGCNIIWYCQTWSLEQYQQLNKRLHRQGQKHGVVVNHLVIKGTIDDRVAKVLSRKNLTQQKLLDFLRNESNY